MKDPVQTYLGALESADLETLLALFTPDAVVHSPLYGVLSPQDFYPKLLEETHQSQITLKGILTGPPYTAAYFTYTWTLKNSKTVTFDCVDLFEQAPGSDRFKSLTILYDTYPVRENGGLVL